MHVYIFTAGNEVCEFYFFTHICHSVHGGLCLGPGPWWPTPAGLGVSRPTHGGFRPTPTGMHSFCVCVNVCELFCVLVRKICV